jgi:hypothetical protein
MRETRDVVGKRRFRQTTRGTRTNGPPTTKTLYHIATGEDAR